MHAVTHRKLIISWIVSCHLTEAILRLLLLSEVFLPKVMEGEIFLKKSNHSYLHTQSR